MLDPTCFLDPRSPFFSIHAPCHEAHPPPTSRERMWGSKFFWDSVAETSFLLPSHWTDSLAEHSILCRKQFSPHIEGAAHYLHVPMWRSISTLASSLVHGCALLSVSESSRDYRAVKFHPMGLRTGVFNIRGLGGIFNPDTPSSVPRGPGATAWSFPPSHSFLY